MSALLGLLGGYQSAGANEVALIERLAAADNGASTNARTVTFTENVLAGDGILLISHSEFGDTASTPSGFSLLGADPDNQLKLFWRIGGGSETGEYTVDYSAASIQHHLHGYLVRGSPLSIGAVAVVQHASATSAQCGGTTFAVSAGGLLVAAIDSRPLGDLDFSFDNSFLELIIGATDLDSAYRSYEGSAAGQGTVASWTTSVSTNSALILIEVA